MIIIESIFKTVRKAIAAFQKGGVSSGAIPEKVRKQTLSYLRDKKGLLLDICGSFSPLVGRQVPRAS